MAVNAFELWYIVAFFIYSDRRLFKLKVTESTLFLSLEALLFSIRLICLHIDQGQYLGWGYVLSIIVLMTMLVTMGRVIFILYLKYVQSKGVSFEEVDIDQRKLQTERAV